MPVLVVVIVVVVAVIGIRVVVTADRRTSHGPPVASQTLLFQGMMAIGPAPSTIFFFQENKRDPHGGDSWFVLKIQGKKARKTAETGLLSNLNDLVFSQSLSNWDFLFLVLVVLFPFSQCPPHIVLLHANSVYSVSVHIHYYYYQ